MGKPYAVAAIITMVIGSGYILYTSFYVQSQGISIPVASEAISTTSESVTVIKTEVVKPVPSPAKPVSTQQTALFTALAGVSFEVPVGMTEVNQSAEGERRAALFRSTDAIVTKFPITTTGKEPGMADANKNSLQAGREFFVVFSPKNIGDSISTPQKYAEFELKLLKDSGGNCKDIQIVSVGGVPAVWSHCFADDIGGVIRVTMYVNGEMFSAGLGYADAKIDNSSFFKNILATVVFSK